MGKIPEIESVYAGCSKGIIYLFEEEEKRKKN